ncbi:MAG: immune inhibitor A domain-containing protein, partial [Poseidonia sp.]
MKRLASMVLAVLLLSASLLMWFNGSGLTDWLTEQRIIIDDGEGDSLLGLQEDEHWLVVVVDFPDHPASDAWGPTEAQTLLDQAAKPYIDQLSGGTSSLTLDVHPDVVRASSNLAAYGSDGTGKDTDESGQFLPAQLAQEVVERLEESLAWEDADLDGNGQVDRLLILHSTKGQEESSGVQERIWSHFTTFEEPLAVKNGLTVAHYTMASLQTGSSGVGTILHEMLHQMGAVDLYPVHDEGSFQAWKGPGDWDIMASGNWNGGG